ncbi:MAG: DsbA family protein [Anaerolineae bacterium]|nr:DsbA family protein [Anaerolineae bacterium]
MSSRARTRERREEREKQRKRNRQLLLVGVIAAVAVILVVLLVISNLPADATIAPETVALYDGIPQSTTAEGFPLLGNPEAPVSVSEYSSFDCPHCAEFYESTIPALVERARAEDISFTYVPLFGTGGIFNGEGAAKAALCAGNQGEFWVYHGALFHWQTQFANQAFGANRLEAGAANLGLDVAAWKTCIQSDATNQVLVAANGAASQLDGFTGTPTIAVNGVIVQDANGVVSNALPDINAAIDAALAVAPASPSNSNTAGAEATAEVTPEVTQEASQ